MRIIAGERRGKKLLALEGEQVRPTTNMVKEALFNILQFNIEGRRFLDLFAGSGQIGLEALSRGAAEAVLVDANRDAIKVVQKNVEAAGFTGRARVVSSGFEGYLRGERGCFDVAFLDPPYGAGLMDKALALTAERMAPGGIILCEHGSREDLPERAGAFEKRKVYRYGRTALTSYQAAEAGEEAGGGPVLEEMSAFFANRLEGYDQHMRQEIEGAEEFYPFTAEQLPDEPGARVLDLGCGTGLELEAYFARNPQARVTGIDLSPDMLGALRKKFPEKDLTLLEGSYFEMPLGEAAFDGAVSVESLHHFPAGQKRELYAKLCRALRPDGAFVLTDYFAESPWHEEEYFRELARLKSEQGLAGEGFYHYDTPLTVEHEAAVLREAGFSQVEVLKNWGATYTLKARR